MCMSEARVPASLGLPESSGHGQWPRFELSADLSLRPSLGNGR